MRKPPTPKPQAAEPHMLHFDAPGMRRLSVPIDDETREVFQRMADASGTSLARAISDWLRDTLDAAQQVGTLMEEARERPRLVARQLGAMAVGLSGEISDVQSILRSSAGERQGPAAKRTGAGAPPRPVIRGGKYPGKTRREG